MQRGCCHSCHYQPLSFRPAAEACGAARCWPVLTKNKVTIIVALVCDSLIPWQVELGAIRVLAQVAARLLLFVGVIVAHSHLCLVEIHPALCEGLCPMHAARCM